MAACAFGTKSNRSIVDLMFGAGRASARRSAFKLPLDSAAASWPGCPGPRPLPLLGVPVRLRTPRCAYPRAATPSSRRTPAVAAPPFANKPRAGRAVWQPVRRARAPAAAAPTNLRPVRVRQHEFGAFATRLLSSDSWRLSRSAAALVVCIPS